LETKKPGKEEKPEQRDGSACFSWLHGFQIEIRTLPDAGANDDCMLTLRDTCSIHTA